MARFSAGQLVFATSSEHEASWRQVAQDSNSLLLFSPPPLVLDLLGVVSFTIHLVLVALSLSIILLSKPKLQAPALHSANNGLTCDPVQAYLTVSRTRISSLSEAQLFNLLLVDLSEVSPSSTQMSTSQTLFLQFVVKF